MSNTQLLTVGTNTNLELENHRQPNFQQLCYVTDCFLTTECCKGNLPLFPAAAHTMLLTTYSCNALNEFRSTPIIFFKITTLDTLHTL